MEDCALYKKINLNPAIFLTASRGQHPFDYIEVYKEIALLLS